MNFVKKAITVFLLGCVAGATSAYAEGVCDVSYDVESANVTVKGNTQSPRSNVTLEVLRAGKTETDLKNLSPENADDVISRYDQVTSNENGDFEFVFPLTDESESDTYVVGVSWGGKKNNSTFVYISPKDFKNALESINSAADKTSMADAIESNAKYFGVDISDYNKLTQSEKALIADAIISGRGDGYDAGNFIEALKKSLALQMVNHSKSESDNALDIMMRYDDVLKLSQSESYKTFDKQKDSLKKNIAQAVANGGPYSDIESILSCFEDKTVIYALYSAEGYDGIYTILKDNNHILGIDFTDYDKLKYKSSVDKKMGEKLFSSSKAAAEAFNGYVSDQKKKENSSSTVTVTGGGGGGGGSVKPGGIASSSSIGVISTSSEEKTVRFADLVGIDWAKASVEKLSDKGIVQGRGENKFDPNAYVTREEFAKMLVTALGIYDDTAVCGFDDTEVGAWYYGYVASGVKAGLINGFSDRIFGKGANISREDMALMLYRAAMLKGVKFDISGSNSFVDDDKIANYAGESVKALYSKGVVTGNDKGMFEPKKNATRAETAVMLDRFLGVIQ